MTSNSRRTGNHCPAGTACLACNRCSKILENIDLPSARLFPEDFNLHQNGILMFKTFASSLYPFDFTFKPQVEIICLPT
jgi:hypothetical protein